MLRNESTVPSGAEPGRARAVAWAVERWQARGVAGRLKRAQILLAVDADTGDEAIAASVGVGGSPVHRTKLRFVLSYPDAALSEITPRPRTTNVLPSPV